MVEERNVVMDVSAAGPEKEGCKEELDVKSPDVAALESLSYRPPGNSENLMKPREYIELVLRSESKSVIPKVDMRIVHGIIGIVTEAGELLDALKRHLFYGQPLDFVNLKEELGDSSWYHSLILDAIGSSWEEVWMMNIDKLRMRYPEKFTEVAAKERDLAKERQSLKDAERKD